MPRILLLLSPVLAACTPAPQKAAMPSPSASSEIADQSSNLERPAGRHPDSPGEAQGRRVLSTAFVRIGPDGHLTLQLRDERVLVLRNVVMNPSDYCGTQVAGDLGGAKYCGGYAEVAAARPGGAPTPDQPDVVAPGPVKAAPDFLGRT